ncbi:MAG: hypothetical protein QXP70_01890 [Methanomassiliicoccales archaeon]
MRASKLNEERLLPIIRSRLAMSLSQAGHRTRDIASLLGTTQSAVSQYIGRKRGRSELKWELLDSLLAPHVQKASEMIRTGSGRVEPVELLEIAHQYLILERSNQISNVSSEHMAEALPTLRSRLQLELTAAERYLELANESRDDYSKMLLRMIASDSIRHADVVSQMISWLESGRDAQFIPMDREMLQKMLSIEDSASETPLSQLVEISHPVARLLLEWIDADESKHERVIESVLSLST